MADKVSFYCEHCGRRVSHRDKICPHCGRFFSKVRCPSCGKQGNSEEFLQGCPQCGYMGQAAEVQGFPDEYEVAYVEKDSPRKTSDRTYHSSPVGLIFALVAGIGFLLAAVFLWLTG